MILELHVPEGHDAAALGPLIPELLTYLLSFIYLGVYWTNHHHLLHACQRVTGGILWANLHPLFWLSLVPFTTAWMERTHLAPLPTAAYGFVLLMAAVFVDLHADSDQVSSRDRGNGVAGYGRPEGEPVAAAVPRGDRAGVRQLRRGCCVLRDRRHHVAGADRRIESRFSEPA